MRHTVKYRLLGSCLQRALLYLCEKRTVLLVSFCVYLYPFFVVHFIEEPVIAGATGTSVRLLSPAALLLSFLKAILLVGSNLAVIPGVREALRLGASVGSAPAVVLALNGAASAVYHMCDLEVCAFWSHVD